MRLSDFKLADHLALVLAAVGASFVAIRLLASAEYNVTTAQVLLETQGPGNVLAGTLMSALPFACLAAIGVCFLLASTSPADDSALKISIVFVVGIILFGPLFLGLLTLISLSLTWLHISHGGGGDRELRVGGWLFLGATLVFLLLWTAPWLPREKVEVGERTFDSYVLEQTDSELVMLDHDTALVTRIPLQESTSVKRSYCYDHEGLQAILVQPLISLPYFWKNEDYDNCPDSK